MAPLPVSFIMPVIPARTVVPVTPSAAIPYPVAGIEYLQDANLYQQAVHSLQKQTVQWAALHVVLDKDKHGAAYTRQQALEMVETEWVSCLDDDDLAYPWHLQTHWDLLQEHNADVAYSWFDGNNPFPAHRGRAFDPADPHHITTTITMRTEMAKAIGYVSPEIPMDPTWTGEDWRMILGLRDLGAKFVGTGDVTWHYRVHFGNTSGFPTKGDALR